MLYTSNLMQSTLNERKLVMFFRSNLLILKQNLRYLSLTVLLFGLVINEKRTKKEEKKKVYRFLSNAPTAPIIEINVVAPTTNVLLSMFKVLLEDPPELLLLELSP